MIHIKIVVNMPDIEVKFGFLHLVYNCIIFLFGIYPSTNVL